jgi:hypothetical protein
MTLLRLYCRCSRERVFLDTVSPACIAAKRVLMQAKYTARSRHPNLTMVTLLRLYWPLLLYHSFWVLCEVGIRWVKNCCAVTPDIEMNRNRDREK